MAYENRAIAPTAYPSPIERDAVYADRLDLLRALQDFDPKAKRLREAQTHNAPVLTIRDTPRNCSVCKQGKTYYVVGRRSVHPACGGWRDTLTPDAEADVIFTVAAALPVASVEVIE